MTKQKTETQEPVYRMTYQLEHHDPPILKSDVPKGHGACDAVAVFSVLFENEIDSSCVLQGIDGRTGSEMNHKQLFGIWTQMAATLGETMDAGGERDLCLEVVKVLDRARALAEADAAAKSDEP